jgi:hypothetical protein
MADTLTVSGNKLYHNGLQIGISARPAQGVNHAGIWGNNTSYYWFGRDPGADMIAQLRDDWKSNVVRVPTNQTDWANNANYRAAIEAGIKLYHDAGFIVVLSRMLGHNYATSRHSDEGSYVWTRQVTQRFLTLGYNNLIIEPYNEPVGEPWDRWRSLGQRHVDIIRQEGGRWPILLNTREWANAGDSATQFKVYCPTDPLGRIVAGWHTYNWTGDSAAALASVATDYPIVVGEFNVHRDNRNAPGWLDSFFTNWRGGVWAKGASCVTLGWWWISHYPHADTGFFSWIDSYVHNHPNVLNAVRDPNASKIRDYYRAMPATVFTVGATPTNPTPGAIAVTTPLAISPASVNPGATVSGTVTVKNTGEQPITIVPAVAVRPPGGTKAGGPYNFDMNPKAQVTIAGGASFTLNASVALPASAEVGTWLCYFTYQNVATGVWTNADVAQDKTFTVAAPAAWSPTITPIATPALLGATIAWATDQQASSRVEWGITSALGSTTEETDLAPRVTNHSVPVGPLSPGTLYHARVVSTNAAGQTAQSGIFTFTTLALPALGSLTPNAATAGDTSLVVQIGGSGFRPGVVAELDGAALVTSYVSPTQLQATIPTASMASAGARQIKVRAPEYGPGATALISGALAFTVNPSLEGTVSLDLVGRAKLDRRLRANMGAAWVTITAQVPIFQAGDTAYFNGAARQSQVLSPTTLRFLVLPVDTLQTPPYIDQQVNIAVRR